MTNTSIKSYPTISCYAPHGEPEPCPICGRPASPLWQIIGFDGWRCRKCLVALVEELSQDARENGEDNRPAQQPSSIQ